MTTTTARDSKAQRQHKNLALRAKGPIAAEFEDCQQEFVRLSDSLHLNRLRLLVEKCRRRFDVWDDDSGASSRRLDYALKSSPSLQSQTISLLGDLRWTLNQAILSVPLEDPQSEEASRLASTKQVNDNETRPLSIDDLEDDEDTDMDYGPASWLQEAFDIVDNLVHLLAALRNPFEEPVPSDTTLHVFECSSFDSFWHAARDLFPDADAGLLGRLVQAQWLTRRALPSAQDRPVTRVGSNETSSTSRALMPHQVWPLHRRNQIAQEFRRADSDVATSTIRSHPDTVLSRTAIVERYSATSVEDSSQPHPVPRESVPGPPVDLEHLGDGNFDCPYCHCELPFIVGSRMTNDDWAVHFYEDTKPYICTFDECKSLCTSFASREQWFRHELDFHRTSPFWSCGLCNSKFQEENTFEHHFQLAHTDKRLPRDLNAITKACKKLGHCIDTVSECRFCRSSCDSLEELENHLGNHMEAFAIETARQNEPRTGRDVEDKESLDMKVMEYLSEQPFDNAAYENERQSTTAPKVRDIVGPEDAADAKRLADPGNSLDINEANQPESRRTGSNWTDKVTSFLDQQDSAAPVEYNLPTRYENFAGREQDLRRIHETLSSPARICVLTGVSGIGKTATAVEYAYSLGIDNSYVFWVEAESPGLLADKYAKIATKLHLDRDGVQNDNSVVFRVREALLKLDKKWLLIFDNAVAWADINPYVTKALMLSKGSVLITTREHPLESAPKWLNQRRVELGPLSTEHGQEFLLKSIHPRLHKEPLEYDEDFELAANIVEILDGLPLAISMVVGYVKESRCTLSDFLEMWEEKESRSRKPRKASMPSNENVNTTVDSLWDIGIREVPSNSRKLLNILAFLSPDRIPKSLLVGDHEEDYLELLNSSEMKSYNRMINKLKSRRLISVKEGTDGQTEYSIHRLLKDKIMFDMDDYSIADAFRKTFRLIRKKFPSADPQQVPNPTNWATCQEYMPHIDTFHQVFTMEQDRILPISAVGHIELAELFYDAGFHVWARRGTLYDGLNLLRTAISLLDKMNYDRDSKLRADINCMVGLLMLEMGCKDRIRGTEHLLEVRRIRAVIYEQHPDHHDSDVLRMNATSDYALCLMNYHRFDEAGDDMLKCYKRYQEWGSEDDNPFENSKHFGNYSIVLMFQGKMDDAIDSVNKCLKQTEKFSGKNAQWYRRLFLLASIYLQAGDLQQALALHHEILAARLKQDGKHDANFLLSLYAVGAMYHHLNNLEEAIVYMKQCVDCAMNSRWSTEGLARAEFHLAMLYDKLGIEEDQSRMLKEKARKVLEQNREFAAECVQDSEDELMIFDDLQPTLLGRYTGTTLLKRLQEKLRRS